jgi:hypothetical protein
VFSRVRAPEGGTGDDDWAATREMEMTVASSPTTRYRFRL